MNSKYRVLQTYTLWGLDMSCIVASFLIATWMRYSGKNDYGDKALHYLVCVLFLLVGTIYTFLADWNRDFISRGFFAEAVSVIRLVTVITVGALVAVFFLKWNMILSRYVILHFIWIEILLTYIVRIVFKKIFRNHVSADNNVVRVVIVAENDLVEDSIRNLLIRAQGIGYKIVRAYAVNSDGSAIDRSEPWYVDGVHVHVGIDNLTSRLLTDPFDEVFINTPNIPQKRIDDIIIGFEEMGVTSHYCVELPSVSKAKAQFDDFMDYSVITYTMNRTSYKRLFIKRLFDIIGGFVGLVLTGIITLFLAPAIKIDSPGPVFFSQTRIGKNGRRFKIYKFRSMYVDAEERKKELEAQNEVKGLMFKMENDPRITKVGAFIRKTSLDEFPQFLNVIKGDMSLVGTRPPTEDEFLQYNEHYRRRLSMTPGLTGLWQISGRSNIDDFDEVVKLDLEYIDNWSLKEDLRIILMTVFVVLFGRGAK